MHPALWVSKTGLSAQDIKLSTISNNLANVNTTGFKRDRAVFQDLLYQVNRQPGGLNTQNSELPSGLQLGTGVRVVGTTKQFSQGNLQITEQPLDLAINGRGFLQIQLPDGQMAYTRDGHQHHHWQGWHRYRGDRRSSIADQPRPDHSGGLHQPAGAPGHRQQPVQGHQLQW
jgi:flagellar hook-basal body protein